MKNRLKQKPTVGNYKLLVDQKHYSMAVEFKDEHLNIVYNTYPEEAETCISAFMDAAVGLLFAPASLKPQMRKNFKEFAEKNLKLLRDQKS